MRITLAHEEIEKAIREYIKHHFPATTSEVKGVEFCGSFGDLYVNVEMEAKKAPSTFLYRGGTGGCR